MSAPGSARAEGVVLIRPPASDPLRSDAFNRLLGELHIHGFATRIEDSDATGDPVDALRQVVRKYAALAGLQLVRDERGLWLAVVLIERESGAARSHRLDMDTTNADAASLLALRAVDLLRASLLRVPEPRPPPAAARASPVAPRVALPPPSATATPARAAGAAQGWSLAIEGDVLWAGERIGIGYGPALGVFHRPEAWFQWGLWLAAPTFGTGLRGSAGSARVWQETLLLEARATFMRVHGFGLAASAGGGAFLLQAEGAVREPFVSERDAVWSGAFALGLRAEQLLGAVVSVGLSVRALALVPALGVAILNERAALQFPLLRASLGLSVALE